jgi:hypothetical protein
MTSKKNKTEKNADFDFTTIKTFEDACKKENLDPGNLPDVSMVPEDLRKALVNVYKLFIIYKAINNGWTPNWNNSNEYKYFPWLEVEASKVVSSGFGFSYSFYLSTHALTYVGSRLCTDTRDKALYIAKQFQAEYKEFFLITQ